MTALSRQMFGYVRLRWHLFNPTNSRVLNEIVLSQFNDKTYPSDKTFVMMVGFSKSGKTYIVENNSLLKDYFKISTNRIHDALNNKFEFLKDDCCEEGRGYWEKQYLTKIVRDRVLFKALSMGVPIVNDSCNLRRKDRNKTLRRVKLFDYHTVVISVECRPSELKRRLAVADEHRLKKNEKPVWLHLYQNIQKSRFDEPHPSECDELVFAISPTNTPESVY